MTAGGNRLGSGVVGGKSRRSGIGMRFDGEYNNSSGVRGGKRRCGQGDSGPGIADNLKIFSENTMAVKLGLFCSPNTKDFQKTLWR